MSKIGTVFIMAISFVFTAFLFPILHDDCRNVSDSLPLAPLIRVFPYIFLVVCVLVPIYFGLKKSD